MAAVSAAAGMQAGQTGRRGYRSTKHGHEDRSTVDDTPVFFDNPMELGDLCRSTATTFASSPKAGSASPMGAQRQAYEKMFSKYDSNDSGAIEEKVMLQMLEEVGAGEDAAELVDSMRKDGKGQITFDEFNTAMNENTSEKFAAMSKSIEDKIFGEEEDRGEVKRKEIDPDKISGCCGLAYPNANRRQIYDLGQLALLCYTLYSVPLQIAFSEEAELDSPLFWLDFVIWSCFLCDMPIQANTYYLYTRTGEWITEGKQIRARYYKSWLIVDLIACFPIDYLLRFGYHFGDDIAPSAKAGSVRMLRLARLFRYLRLLKMMSAAPMINKMLEKYQEKIGFSRQQMEFIYKLLNLVAVIYSFNHLAGCMWVFVGRIHSNIVEPPFPDPPEGSWWDAQYGQMVADGVEVTASRQYIDAMYFVMMTLTSVGYGDITPQNDSEKWYVYILMYCTAFVYAYVIGVFADMVASRRMDRNKFDQKMRQVFEFLEHCECPEELQQAAKTFYMHRFPRKTLFDEQVIYDELPPKFTKQLVLHRFERAVHSVPFFRSASDECVVDICREFRGMPALAGDEIVVKGEHNHELIILEYGEAVGKDGTLATRYKAGSFFGEMEFLGLSEGSLSQVTVTAVTDCDLYTLRFGDIGHVLMEFPEMQQRLTQYARLRLEATNKQGGVSKEKDTQAKPKEVVPTLKVGSKSGDHQQEATYDIASASQEMERCSKADLQGAVLRAVLTGRITVNDLRDL